MTVFAGGCVCGAIRYEADAEPVFSVHCCCRKCQHLSGAGHSSQIALPASVVSWTGEPRWFASTADSGNAVENAFCPTCGSPLANRSAGLPDMVFFHAGSLDDPGMFKPQLVVWTSKKQPWDDINPTLHALAKST